MKYIIYCRKSTDTEDKQVLSLELQENELRGLAQSNGLEVVLLLQESMSAKEPGRPIFNQMISLITQGRADAILCWKIDRLIRNPVDGGQLQWLLQNNKIQSIQTFERQYLPSDNVMLMSVEQAMANQYIRELSANVKRGNRAKLERGEWPSNAPLGYLNDKATKTIVIDPQKSPYVSRAFDLYVNLHKNFNEISLILHNEGLRTRAGKKVVKSQIHKIIKNPFYTGIMVQHGKQYQGKHVPLVSKSVFDKAQDILNNKSRPRPQHLFFPLRGFLKCETCGCSLTATVKKEHHYYYCTNGKGQCHEHKSYMREIYLYTVISEIFEKLDFSERKIEIMYRAAKEKIDAQASYINQIIQNLESSLTSLKTKESRLLDAFLDGQIAKDQFDTKQLEIHNEQFSLNKQIDELKTTHPLATLEPTKELFLQASRAKKEFLEADDTKKKEITESLLWNISIKNKTAASIKLKSPFDIMFRVPKDAPLEVLLPIRDSNPN